jgi:SAM-dependent methyltransferase
MRGKSGFQLDDDAPRYYESQVERFMAPFVDVLVAAAVKPGDAVLDVACGTGFAARAARVATGASGRVIGSDLNPGMLALAQSLSTGDGGDISWQQASALDLPFADGEFDTAISQQGIQFFPDSAAGLRDMARVTKPGGRLAATVWAERERSPYLDAVFGMLTRHCGADPAANAKVFADSGAAQVRGWFEAAGLAVSNIEAVTAKVRLPPIVEYVPEHLKALPALSRGHYFELDAEARNALLRQLECELGAYVRDDGLEVPFQSFLAVARV